MFDRTVRESVRLGLVRPNTPIAWSYSQHEGYGFSNNGFGLLRYWIQDNYQPWEDVNKNAEIQAVIQNSNFKIPSDYPDQMLELMYGAENIGSDAHLFRCDTDEPGVVTDCKPYFSNWITTNNFVCNARNSFDIAIQVTIVYIILFLLASAIF